MQDDEKEKA